MKKNPDIFMPDVFRDDRGYMRLPFDQEVADKLDFTIRQINQSYTYKKNTLRGLHYQKAPYAQAKLIACLRGSVYSVAVDIRKDSETFGRYTAEVLSFENGKVMYIPRGFAHGYLTLEDDVFVQWCVDNDFCKEVAKALRFDDPNIQDASGNFGIPWPGNASEYMISHKDQGGMSLLDIARQECI